MSLRSSLVCCELEIQGEKKGPRQLAAAAARDMSDKLASAEQPSDPGSTGLRWAAEEQHWVPLFTTLPEAPLLNSSHVSCNSCARLRQRLCRR